MKPIPYSQLSASKVTIEISKDVVLLPLLKILRYSNFLSNIYVYIGVLLVVIYVAHSLVKAEEKEAPVGKGNQ